MILLDTQALIWLVFDSPRLGEQSRKVIASAEDESQVAVSAITFWEVAMLHAKGRLTLLTDVDSWRADLLERGVAEIPVDGAIGIHANELEDFHPDPADRLIVATALTGHQLVTADRRILDWPGNLSRLDASE